MNVITRAQLASTTAERWHRQYWIHRNGIWRWWDDEKRAIYHRLAALESPTPETVNTIIGNDSWTRTQCDECGREVEATIRLGEAPDYESAPAHICLDCLRKALVLFEAEVVA